MKNNLKRALALCLALALMLPLLTTAAHAASDTFPRYTGASGSIVDGLKAVGADSSFAYRGKIAAANGIVSSESAYKGTAAQNVAMLKLLKAGQLKKPGSAAPAPSAKPAQNSSGGSLVSASLKKVSFLRQPPLACKATAAVMGLNLIVGGNRYAIKDLLSAGSTYSCKNLQGFSFQGGDGKVYRTTYKFDTYIGSRSELVGQIETALAHGLPIVAAVHSTRYNAPHHWIVVVGKQGSDYLVLDPSYKGSGLASANVRTMKSLGYDLGITDVKNGPGYGYISFQQQ
ncbi:MAG: hypothetical protein NC489_44050 [Ruminococcus flavefaciens]|nr:hypothetical protein [Ruminococcus flavefaciens]